MVFLKVIYPEGQMNNLKLHYASSHKVQNILRNVDKQTQNAKARLDGDRHGWRWDKNLNKTKQNREEQIFTKENSTTLLSLPR